MKIILFIIYSLADGGVTIDKTYGFNSNVKCETQANKIIKEFNASRDSREKLQAYCIMVN